MGLVATWLNGIGLRSVVPTFEAAGIVSPSHLADLDVSYFESLGVTDPDDRRKLFYLVQRIKMAVNKKDSSDGGTPSVEERVDAVISKNLVSEDEDNSDNDNDPDYEEEDEKKDEVEPLRRSRRLKTQLKKKKKDKKKDEGSKENNNSETEIPDPKSLETRKKVSTRKKVKEVEASPPSSPSRNTSARKLTKEKKEKKEAKKEKKEAKKEKKEKKEKEKKKKEAPERLPTSSKLVVPSALPCSSTPKKGVKEEIGDSDVDEGVDSSPSSLASSDLDPTKKGGNSIPSRQQRESKLPGSSRVDKHSQKISSMKAPTGGPAVETFSPHSDKDTDIDRPNANRRATLTAKIDSLEKTFRSSASQLSTTKERDDNDGGKEINQRGRLARPTAGMSRSSKSMSVSDSARLQQFQRNQEKRSSASSSTSNIVTTTRPSSIRASIAPSVVTQVASGAAESWATKIDYLREDNEAEHELFRDQLFDESQYQEYYDMRIKVIVRKRPISKSESLTGGIDIIHPLDYGSYGRTLVYQPKTRVDLTKEVETVPFAFDNVFDESSTNIGIYNRSLRNLVEPFFEGQWATVFAYGQTGSGKTYTMMGSNITGINAGTATNDEANLGLYYLAALDIFEMIELPEYQHLKVHISLFEIYGGKLFDLLNERKQIKCLEDSKGKVCFPGLTEHSVHAPEHVMQLIEKGAENRSTGTTSRNADSSRSHAVLQIKLMKNSPRNKTVEHGRFSFIDLAGSERGADTNNASRTTRLEGAEINTSLLALKEVIRALATGGSMTHIPFRGSKLTQVLKDSFVGKNSRCCMVACVSPDIGNCEQTLNTLRYADRVKERNPETGVLSSSCQQPAKIISSHSLKLSTKQSSIPPKPKDEIDEVHGVENNLDDDGNFLDDLSAGDDDLLEQSLQDHPSKDASHEMVLTQKQKAGLSLVSNHRSVMSRWLSMVKNEMALVNQVDNNREGLDDYLGELQNIQRTQIGFLSELRTSLQNYVSAAEAPHGIDSGEHEHDDDDSFEDLRD